MLTPDANVPGLHGVSTVLPVGAKWPAVVSVHSLRLRRAGTLGAVRARLAGNAPFLAFVGLVRACCAPVARALACDGLDGAGAALGLLGAARWRKASLVGWRALTGAHEVGGDRVRALRARQRRAGALGAVRARVTGNARLLALAGLVRACRALVAGALLRDGLDGAGATLGLLGAARRREVALVRRRTLVGTVERSAGALGAVRARLAGDTRLLALAGLVRACRAHVARGHARVWRDRAGAALTRLCRARTARRSWRALQAVVGARHQEAELQHRLVLVAACLARQRGRRALRAVRAGRARPAHQLARRGLEGAGLALETRAHACVGRDRAGAAERLLGAARRREVAEVSPCALVLATQVGCLRIGALRARQRRAGANGAIRAGLAGNASLLAFALLVSACRALVARALAGVGLDGAGAALCLLRAARRREVARAGSRAVGSGAKVGHVGRCRRALWAVRARHAHVTLGLARLVHELARAALVTHGLLVQRLHGTRAARRLLGASGWRKVARVGLRALTGAAEVGGARVRALLARQRRASALRAVRARLAGDARLLALVCLVLARGAFDTKGSARGGRNEAGRAVSAVGWFGAPRNRICLARSASLARRAAILTAVWVERAGEARRERLAQARRSLCRTMATTWTVAAHGRFDAFAQFSHRACGATCASFVRVVGPGCARNAAIVHQAGDADRKVCSGRTQEWLNSRSRAVIAAVVALATASVFRLLARVAEVAKRALVRAAFEAHWGQGERRWRTPPAERAVDDGVSP
eukprot:scaffold36779_cov71-Phaeocystis_antarctica.AAC.1